MYEIFLSIMFLAPHLGPTTSRQYAKFIHTESKYYHVDPLDLVAIIHTETSKSWRMDVRSKTHDYGLGQIHVSKTSNSHLLGFEEVLFDPATNIHYSASTLLMWKKYHEKTCYPGEHEYFSHYQYGYRVRNLKWTNKVRALRDFLVAKFRPGMRGGDV